MNNPPFQDPGSTATSLECARVCAQMARMCADTLRDAKKAQAESKPFDHAKLAKSDSEVRLFLTQAKNYAVKHCEPELAEVIEELTRLQEDYEEFIEQLD